MPHSPQQFLKTPQQVKEQIERWYLKYHRIDYDLVDPMGVFTLFDKLPSLKKEAVTQNLELANNELPVLVLWINDNSFIVNTTHRFINVAGDIVKSIMYAAFNGHTGYKCLSRFSEEKSLVKHLKKMESFKNLELRVKTSKLNIGPYRQVAPATHFGTLPISLK